MHVDVRAVSSTKLPLTRRQAERAWRRYEVLRKLRGLPPREQLTARKWRRCLICGWPTEFNYACEAEGYSGRSCWWKLCQEERDGLRRSQAFAPVWYDANIPT